MGEIVNLQKPYTVEQFKAEFTKLCFLFARDTDLTEEDISLIVFQVVHKAGARGLSWPVVNAAVLELGLGSK